MRDATSETTCSTGIAPAALRISLEEVAAQPARALPRGCVETITSSGSLDRDRVLDGGERVGVDDVPGSRDPGFAKARQRPVEPPAGGGAARVLVDDVALARRVHGRDHDDDRVGVGSRCAPRRAAVAGDGLVRDDEDLARGRRSSHGLFLVRAVGQLDVRSAVEDGVAGAGNAVLVRSADDLRDLVEVEDAAAAS